MKPTPAEREKILSDWQAFAQTKVFAFRGISPEIYAALAPAYFRAIIDRSQVRVSHTAPEGYGGTIGLEMIAAVVYEPIPDSNAIYVHWAWTHHKKRNLGHQHALWIKADLDQRNVCATHLTVLAEKLIDKYNRSPNYGGWRYSPLSLYKSLQISTKEAPNADEAIENGSAERHENAEQPGE